MPRNTTSLVSVSITLLMAAIFALAIVGRPAEAATFTVTKVADTNDGTCDADCSLREAIGAANAAGGADSISLPAGTYTLSIAGLAEDANATGDLDITGDLTINGAGAATTIIDADTIDRVFHILSSATVNINDITMQNGDPGFALGGGIHNDSGTLTLTNSVVDGSRANQGGGILNDAGELLTLVGSTVNGTLAGTGIQNNGTASLTNSTITNNMGGNGGGIGVGNALDATLTVIDSTISGNTATVDGGGIRMPFGGNLTVTNSTVNNNTALIGGGIVIGFGTATLTNVTVSGNMGTSRGGGIDVLGSTEGVHTLTNVTISGNSSPTGGGFNNIGSAFTFTNTIVANQTSGADCAGDAITTGGNNLDSDNTCGLTDPDDVPNVDPLLGPLQDNGGATETQALLTGSPAIDAGDDTACPATDQRGVARPQGAQCDIGAYEAPSVGGPEPTPTFSGPEPTPTFSPTPTETPITPSPTSTPAPADTPTATATAEPTSAAAPIQLPQTGGGPPSLSSSHFAIIAAIAAGAAGVAGVGLMALGRKRARTIRDNA